MARLISTDAVVSVVSWFDDETKRSTNTADISFALLRYCASLMALGFTYNGVRWDKEMADITAGTFNEFIKGHMDTFDEKMEGDVS